MLNLYCEAHTFRGFGDWCHIPVDLCRLTQSDVKPSSDWMAVATMLLFTTQLK